MSDHALLQQAHTAALRFLSSLADRKVAACADASSLREALGGPLPTRGESPDRVLAAMIAATEPGLVASAGPRYFGFVVGGALPVALAADWLTSAWDQNAFGYVLSPAASVVEEVCAAWLLSLLGLPPGASVGFVTGGQMANFSALCAARDEVLRRAGADLEQDGLHGAPLSVFVGAHAHSTIYTALRMLGIGRRQCVRVEADAQGRMLPAALSEALSRRDGPAIVCLQAGDVNTGAFDAFEPLIDAAHAHGAWVHVDGAFGLWAAASASLRGLLQGVERADSWAVDAHKWLNVPYDAGIVIVADPRAHHDALRTQPAAYLVRQHGERDGSDWVPEASRRARAFALYATLRTLGRDGVAALVEQSCALARSIAAQLVRETDATIVNDVVLNQVLVRFGVAAGEAQSDALTQAVIAHVQREGTCWVGPTQYAGRVAMRIALSNWRTSEQDIARSVAAIAEAVRASR